jgi:hypothetical protein
MYVSLSLALSASTIVGAPSETSDLIIKSNTTTTGGGKKILSQLELVANPSK